MANKINSLTDGPPETVQPFYALLDEAFKDACPDKNQRRVEILQLLSAFFGLDNQALILDQPFKISSKQWSGFLEILEKRLYYRTPLQYLIGDCEFYGYLFKVTSDVLIPRPETELLVEAVMNHVVNNQATTILDVGTGSGCIAITLFKELKCHVNDLKITAVDLSETALIVAKENAAKLLSDGVKDIQFIQSDCFTELGEQSFDVIVSNPPYIGVAEKSEMMPEVLNHEPDMALFPPEGKPQTWFYEKIAAEGKHFLNNQGAVFVELGTNLAEPVTEIFKAEAFYNIKVQNDYAGLPRVLSAEFLKHSK